MKTHAVRWEHGVCCGYVLIPEGHPWHGLGYDAIEERGEVDVPGGLTHSGQHSKLEAGWWVGFDLNSLASRACANNTVEDA